MPTGFKFYTHAHLYELYEFGSHVCFFVLTVMCAKSAQVLWTYFTSDPLLKMQITVKYILIKIIYGFHTKQLY